ncbi:DUF1611 domain-containing protein [Candidatus Woesearchaeota archaeon]|nr:DUF1611 domain-containing protein [Candidatus Woesearchaeota archaeon]
MKESALVLCQDFFDTTSGKTTHGLVRHSERYEIKGIIDSNHAGEDAGLVLDGKPNGIKFFSSLGEAIKKNGHADNLIVGVSPDGGTLPESLRSIILEAIGVKMSIVSGLHTFLSEDKEFSDAARENGVELIDVRKPKKNLHFFSGKIEEVASLKVAVLGTDSAIGKRTTAIKLVEELNARRVKAVLIGTGQTAWMQGAKYSIVFDSIINDYVTGEIEHAVHSAFISEKPDVIVIEGQGAILHPAYSAGFEIICGARPDAIIVQHAPKRKFLDGFSYPMPELKKTIGILNILSDGKVAAITINHEGMNNKEIDDSISEYEKEYKIPCYDPLRDGNSKIIEMFLNRLIKK